MEKDLRCLSLDNHGHGYPVGIFVVEDEAQQPWVVQ